MLAPDLSDWVARLAGPVTSARQIPGGNRRQAWLVDAGGEALFLRVDAAPDPDDPHDLAREAAWYAALGPHGVAIPGMLGFDPALNAMLIRRVPGGSTYRAIADEATRASIAFDLIDKLAELHSVSPDTLDLPDTMRPPFTIADAIAAEIAEWDSQYRAVGRADPLIELAGRWLRDNAPADTARPAVVHGDAGPGNFMFDGARVTAMVDWELTHFGDPVEDLAWLSMRTVLEPFPDFPACVARYGALMGPVDLTRLRFHRVLVQWRVAIIRWIGQGQIPANSLISSALNRRLLAETLAGAEGLNLPPPPPPGDKGADDALAGTALAELKDDILPALGTEVARQHAKSLARLIKRLRDGPRYAATRAREAEAALARLSPADPSDAGLARLISAGRVPLAEALPYLSRMTGYETRMAEAAMGTLAWRSLPPMLPEEMSA
ncbi:MAG: phosphotransferase family protein [Sagittula sp.]|uniref:phosphotransferase family protein n=1 Tax=Sagittula sp. TaxID=2038081 RepID=UPI00405972F7